MNISAFEYEYEDDDEEDLVTIEVKRVGGEGKPILRNGLESLAPFEPAQM